ncbi:MAG: 23S rRNA (cytidine1920-2'-O)/16S rRNA (cytidine1409-2'-O)-methyltransferase [Alphaproteobacteria bacterium]|nr:MAG: 23S rRNA (cytidine1920-2'-O)/16S rRNA (cytidine1409-2'-O)-methyltransferase [Alphaproteobacteria bacterium]
MGRMRADQLLVARGLAESRARAQAAIEAGGVTANGSPVLKASQAIEEDAVLTCEAPHPWVSASTGGFTQVLLVRGAARVAAVDVGREQLHRTLRDDARVRVMEGVDARTLTAETLGFAPSRIVCDASFIGLGKVLPAPLSLAAPEAVLIALVKPQYEIGPGRGGALLKHEAARLVAEETVRALDGVAGFKVRSLIDSDIRGGDGAPEFVLYAVRS